MWVIHLLISGHDRRTAPKFGTHVRIDTLTLKKNLTHPTPGGYRGLYIVKNLSRRIAPKFGTHVWIDTLTLKKKNLTHPTPGGFRGLYTVEPLTNDHPHQRPSLSYDHISCDGQWFLFVYESLTSDHPSYTTTPM